ncbi:bacterio-opsin activator domain-containing protein, partial [Haloferax profundi]
MSVILEFSIAASDFELGQVLMGPPGMHLEIERVVPTGNMVLPFVWATGDDHDEFTEKVRANPAVRDVCVLDSVEDSQLYRIEWDKEATRLIDIIVASDATVLEARGNRDWLFRLRFPDQDSLSAFHANVMEHDVPITVERTFTSTKAREHGHKFGLTDEQREALVLAL